MNIPLSLLLGIGIGLIVLGLQLANVISFQACIAFWMGWGAHIAYGLIAKTETQP